MAWYLPKRAKGLLKSGPRSVHEESFQSIMLVRDKVTTARDNLLGLLELTYDNPLWFFCLRIADLEMGKKSPKYRAHIALSILLRICRTHLPFTKQGCSHRYTKQMCLDWHEINPIRLRATKKV